MKIIIAGGRDFKDVCLLADKLDAILKNVTTDIEIVSGGQCTTDPNTGKKYGADFIGECYAETMGYKIKRFPADWQSHGRSAGPKRNKEMALYSDALVAFWDGKSRGTKNMIDEAELLGLKVRVIRY